MRRQLLALLLVCAACAAVLGWGLRTAGPLDEPDEAAWVFSTYAYRLAFVDRDLSSPEWKGEDAVDHPPLAKFYLGAALAPAGLVASSPEDKRFWFERAFLPYDRPAFVAALRARVPEAALARARAANAAAMLAACALAAAAGAWLLSAEAGALAALIFAFSAVTRKVGAQAVADGLFVALELACALAQAAWAARLARTKRFSPAWSLLAGVLAGALFDTKISGLLELPLAAGALAAALAAAPRSRELRRAVLRSAACAFAAGVAFAVIADPSLWRAPASFALEMFRHRWETARLQRLVFFGGEFQSAGDLLCGALRGLFWPAEGRPLGAATAVLACAGAARLPRRLASAPPAARVAVLHGAAWTLATLAAFRVDWPRYLLTLLPFAALLAALGAEELASLRPGARARLAAASAAAAALLILPARRRTPLAYWVEHPEEFERRIDVQVRYLNERYPADRATITSGEEKSRAFIRQFRRGAS